MAYVDFREPGSSGAVLQHYCGTPVADPVPSGEARLSALEWSVVALARRDSLASLRRPGRLSMAMSVLFNQRNPRLADTRLEALRRMAVLTWRYGYVVPSHEVRRLFAAGFSPEQYELMVDSIGVARTRGSLPADGLLAAA